MKGTEGPACGEGPRADTQLGHSGPFRDTGIGGTMGQRDRQTEPSLLRFLINHQLVTGN